MPIVLTGFEECFVAMDQIGDRVEKKKVLAGAMRKALQPLLEEGKSRAPFDEENPHHRIEKYMRIAVLNQTSTSVLGKVGDTPKGFVGYLHERGTEFMPAIPFLEPAWTDTESQVVGILGDEVMKGIVGLRPEGTFDNE